MKDYYMRDRNGYRSPCPEKAIDSVWRGPRRHTAKLDTKARVQGQREVGPPNLGARGDVGQPAQSRGSPHIPKGQGLALAYGDPFSGAEGKGSGQILLFPRSTLGPPTLPFQAFPASLGPHGGRCCEKGREGGKESLSPRILEIRRRVSER